MSLFDPKLLRYPLTKGLRFVPNFGSIDLSPMNSDTLFSENTSSYTKDTKHATQIFHEIHFNGTSHHDQILVQKYFLKCLFRICLITPGCFNVQTSYGFKNFCYLFGSESSDMSITACFQYNTYYWVDVTSVTFNNKKVYEDKIFRRQDILHIFLGAFKDYKYVKSPNAG